MRRRRLTTRDIVTPVIVAVGLLLEVHSIDVFAVEPSHLLPAAPFFDTQGEHAKQYGEFCEKILFPPGGWEFRYYEVIANPSATMGISFYRTDDGDYFIEARQSTPELKSVIQNADYETGNFQAIYKRINVERAKRRLPTSTASEMKKLWLWALSEVDPQVSEGQTIFMDAPLIILYARAKNGTVLSGKFPSNHQGISKFVSFRDIVAKLITACDAKERDRRRLFAEAERASEKLREEN